MIHNMSHVVQKLYKLLILFVAKLWARSKGESLQDGGQEKLTE
jgi:hypothetical protein